MSNRKPPLEYLLWSYRGTVGRRAYMLARTQGEANRIVAELRARNIVEPGGIAKLVPDSEVMHRHYS